MPITICPSSPTNLVAVDRALQIPLLSTLNTTNPGALSALISAASTAIKTECKRQFIQSAYTEYFSGSTQERDRLQEMILSEFPVVSISRIACDAEAALFVSNLNTTGNQRATVATSSAGVTVLTVASGVMSSSFFPYSQYPTLQSIATAISALGNGWSATVPAPFSLWASVDLRARQGAISCIGNNEGIGLELFTENLNEMTWSPGWCSGDNTYGWRIKEKAGILAGIFPTGTLNIRVDYIGGYVVIPEDLQQATIQYAYEIYQASKFLMYQQSQTIGPYSEKSAMPHVAFSPLVMRLIGNYRAHDKLLNGVVM